VIRDLRLPKYLQYKVTFLAKVTSGQVENLTEGGGKGSIMDMLLVLFFSFCKCENATKSYILVAFEGSTS